MMSALLDCPGVVRWFRQRRRLPALVLLLVVGLAGAGAQWPGPESFPEYFQSFRGDAASRRGWELKGEDAEQRVRFEPAGVRITLPAGKPPTGRGTGVFTKLGVRGDFEITVSFEVLHEPEPQDAALQTRVSLEVLLDRHTNSRNMAALTRKVDAEGTEFTGWQVVREDAAAPEKNRQVARPTAAKTGRLRLQRTGAVLSYAVAEGDQDEFSLLGALPFGPEDLKEVRLAASTGGPKASYDVRLADLHVRPQSLPVLAETPAPTTEAAPAKGKGGLAAAVLFGLTLVLISGVWLHLRRGRRTGQAPAAAPEETSRAAPAVSVAFACVGCGKRLEARAALAGKKVKCPQCGQAVLVPATRTGEAGPAPG